MYTILSGLKVKRGVDIRTITAMAIAFDQEARGATLQDLVSAGAIISADFVDITTLPLHTPHIDNPAAAFFLARGECLQCKMRSGDPLYVALPAHGDPLVSSSPIDAQNLITTSLCVRHDCGAGNGKDSFHER